MIFEYVPLTLRAALSVTFPTGTGCGCRIHTLSLARLANPNKLTKWTGEFFFTSFFPRTPFPKKRRCVNPNSLKIGSVPPTAYESAHSCTALSAPLALPLKKGALAYLNFLHIINLPK